MHVDAVSITSRFSSIYYRYILDVKSIPISHYIIVFFLRLSNFLFLFFFVYSILMLHSILSVKKCGISQRHIERISPLRTLSWISISMAIIRSLRRRDPRNNSSLMNVSFSMLMVIRGNLEDLGRM